MLNITRFCQMYSEAVCCDQKGENYKTNRGTGMQSLHPHLHQESVSVILASLRGGKSNQILCSSKSKSFKFKMSASFSG